MPPVDSAPGDGGAYAFIRTLPDGSPVTYAGCDPIHYVINPRGGPAYGTDMIRWAVGKVGSASGLHFVYDGFSAEQVSEHRDYSQRDGAYPPVLIGWATEATYPSLGGSIAGRGGSVAVSSATTPWHYVSGQVVLDIDDFARMQEQDRTITQRVAVLHELGHVVGLQHVDDVHQVMYSRADNREDWGDGDLAGLALVGRRGTCGQAG